MANKKTDAGKTVGFTAGKAVGVTSGGGMGAFLLKLSALIPNQTVRDLCITAIPIASIGLSELFTFIWVIFAVDPQEIRLKRKLKSLKKRVEKTLNPNVKHVSPELREKAQSRYDVLCEIEMGLIPMTVLNNIENYPVRSRVASAGDS